MSFYKIRWKCRLAASWMAEESEFGSRYGRDFFILFTSSRPVLGPTLPPIQWVPGVERQGREVDHSLPTSAEVKNTWIHTSTPPYVFNLNSRNVSSLLMIVFENSVIIFIVLQILY
jgi:hypothetical protein